MSNNNLGAARSAKNDEFYTRVEDIENELYWYQNNFKDKIVYLPCDDPGFSKFWWYFHMCFAHLGLKKLVCTHYVTEGITYVAEYTGGNDEDITVMTTKQLLGNGDFRNAECLNYMEEADVVCTNPPFSLFREFVNTLEQYNKKYLIIGSQNAFTYKDIFTMMQNNKLWTGYNLVKEFTLPDGGTQKFGNICWFTNIDIKKRHERLILVSKYEAEKYPKYDGYDVIEVSKLSNIPEDYDGMMGVPITYLEKHCPEQFDILGIANSARYIGQECLTIIDGRKIYNRIIIKKK